MASFAHDPGLSAADGVAVAVDDDGAHGEFLAAAAGAHGEFVDAVDLHAIVQDRDAGASRS
jgi:hypothetical protein